MSTEAPDTPGTGAPTKHKAGAFDVRTVIGSLLAVYGVILTALGLFGNAQLDLTGGINANLWAGLALLAVGAAFLLWAKARPIIVDESTIPHRDENHRPGH